MKVKITYYLPNGKPKKSFERNFTADVSLPMVCVTITVLRDTGKLPGLIAGEGSNYHILVVSSENPEESRLISPRQVGGVSFGDGAEGNFVNTGNVLGDIIGGDKVTRRSKGL